MGTPPLGLPARVKKRREHWVTSVGARTDRRSLETEISTPQEAASTTEARYPGSIACSTREALYNALYHTRY
jgi:hypothetical protein